ncbi:hypothetical protein GCM10023095_06350 [Pseudaeromonas paramecii]|uniref:Uncharacterized protein n=1 Tax=Pseudaeromonas paramecii TaxID=2138166 RepID=A0ABP8PYB9_9GAMM
MVVIGATWLAAATGALPRDGLIVETVFKGATTFGYPYLHYRDGKPAHWQVTGAEYDDMVAAIRRLDGAQDIWGAHLAYPGGVIGR